MSTPKSLARYVDEIAFIASASMPYQVSHDQFVAVCALVNDEKADKDARRAAADFLTQACELAGSVEPTAADVTSIYRACIRGAKKKKQRVFGEPGQSF